MRISLRVALCLSMLAAPLCAQTDSQPAAQSHGTVIFSRSDTQDSTATAAPAIAAPVPALTDSERDALIFLRYSLDVHLTPADNIIAVHACLVVRNDSAAPLAHLPLQISSSLHWESVEFAGHALTAKQWQQHQLETDTDHTGAVTEAILTPVAPLAPGASVEIAAVYSGTIAQSGERLTRIGAPAADAAAADWDRITPEFTGLRGFGDVLWYPSSSPAIFLGDGARLFQSAGRMKLRQEHSGIAVRVTLEYTGTTPAAVIFNGVSQPLQPAADELVAADSGILRAATVEFAAQPIGFRMPSLFVVMPAAAANDAPLRAYTTHPELITTFATAASQVQPLVTDWLGTPLPLSLIDLPEPTDQPFESGAMLAVGLRNLKPSEVDLPLAHALARASLSRASVPLRAWLDEGLPQFISLLWIEKSSGRSAAINEMNEHATALALAEPDMSQPTPPQGQSLILATDDIYYRTKAADVWWMLRDLVGDAALQQAITKYLAAVAGEREPSLFQRILQQTSGKDLEWFFDDWVYRDRSLPDLSVANVISRELLGKNEFLVAVEVANDGYAGAEVPVMVRSGELSVTQWLLIPARSHATTRIIFAGRPDEVQVNDGSVPELTSSIHQRRIDAPAK